MRLLPEQMNCKLENADIYSGGTITRVLIYISIIIPQYNHMNSVKSIPSHADAFQVSHNHIFIY